MKRITHFILVCTFLTFSCTGDDFRPENEEIDEIYTDVNFYYLDNEFDDVYGSCETQENTLVVVGETDNLKIGEFSKSNNFEWTREYGIGKANGLISCKDNGFLIFGSTASPSFSDNSYDMYLARTNFEGSIIWEKTYGGSENDNISDAIEIDDGGFILVGNLGKSTGVFSDTLNIKRIDEDGNEIWNYKSNTFSQTGWSICSASNDQFFVLGTGFENYTPYGYTNVMKIDLNRNILWSNHLDGTSIFASFQEGDIVETSDGGCIVAIYSDNEQDDFWAFKYSWSGELLWELKFGGSRSDHFIAIEQAANGYYYIAGETGSHGSGGFDFILVKIDNDGNRIWSKTYGTEIYEDLRDIKIIESEIYMLGAQSGFAVNESRPILLITDLEGEPI